ncbi:FAD-dependent monooxygenase, partial [Paraburkholderia nemoris]|uniref:FAD-dependent monooxygenase n=1 Tax=Paraburkholderia nemoris TaxID=2793076 RepID=UPI0038BAFA14
MPRAKKVLVVGGGIGGLTCAVALAARGIMAEVIEAKPAHQTVGVGIIQPGNALRALKSLGLMQACLDAGFQTDDYVYFDAHENELARLKMSRIAAPNVPAVNFLPRPALHQILDAATRKSGSIVRMGITVSRMVEDEAGIDVSFSDGTEGRYDLVVGADGIRSAARAMLFGYAIDPQYT